MKRTMLIAVVVMGLVFGLVAYAGALTGPTTINANVDTILQLTAPGSASLGTLKPDVSATVNVIVTGMSNRPATMSASVAKGSFTSLSSGLQTAQSGLRGGNISVTDTVTGMVDYFVDAASVSGIVTYSLVQ